MTISFEIFPPKSAEGLSALKEQLVRMRALSPEFVSVTCGAGGNGHRGTAELIETVVGLGMVAVAHATCSGMTKAEAEGLISGYREMGIHGILGLRGDAGTEELGFPDSVSMLTAIRNGFDGLLFCAGYPEPHPESRGEKDDDDWLRRKLDSGVDEVITQYCFDKDAILRFRDAVFEHAPHAKVRVGVLPIRDPEAAVRFSLRCGAALPPRLIAELTELKDDRQEMLRASARATTDLIGALTKEGVEDFHVYTLNSADLSERICEVL